MLSHLTAAEFSLQSIDGKARRSKMDYVDGYVYSVKTVLCVFWREERSGAKIGPGDTLRSD